MPADAPIPTSRFVTDTAVTVVADEERALRSLTVHYLRPPVEGPVAVRATIERQGRSMTTLSVRMEQGDRAIALALASCSARRDAASWDDAPAPAVPPPEDIAWIPPIFSKVSIPLAGPTVDLTVPLRTPLPAGYDDWFLVEFRSETAVDGFVEEDGRVWTRDGVLVAQSRQLAVVI